MYSIAFSCGVCQVCLWTLRSVPRTGLGSALLPLLLGLFAARCIPTAVDVRIEFPLADNAAALMSTSFHLDVRWRDDTATANATATATAADGGLIALVGRLRALSFLVSSAGLLLAILQFREFQLAWRAHVPRVGVFTCLIRMMHTDTSHVRHRPCTCT